MITAPNPSVALPLILEAVANAPVQASRNGETRELTMTQVHLTSSTHPYTITPGRKASLPAQIAETMWVLSGRDDIEWLGHYLPQAHKFSDDGITWHGAYGPRLRRWEGSNTPHGMRPIGHEDTVDQLRHVIDMLRNDPTSRRAVMSIYDPAADTGGGLDVPCNNWLHFLVRDGAVQLHVATRSNDIMWGWSGINAFEWSVLVQVVAAYTGLKPGGITFSISSLHLYERHYTKAQRILDATIGVENELDNDWADQLTSTRVGPVFAPGSSVLDELCDRWFELEARIRTGVGAEGLRRDIDAFPEPLMRAWLEALYCWWNDTRHTFEALYNGTALAAALMLSPKPRYKPRADKIVSGSITADKLVQGSITVDKDGLNITAPRGELADMIARLHEDKGKAYAGSWCKRGEQFSILPNIARKADRLGVDGAGDTAADTFIDLLVYLVKYGTWLTGARNGADNPRIISDRLHSVFRNVQDWKWTEESEAAWVHTLKSGVDKLIDNYDSTTESGRWAQVSHLLPSAAAAARFSAEREGWTY